MKRIIGLFASLAALFLFIALINTISMENKEHAEMRSEEYRYQIENAPDSSVIETRDGSLFIMKKDLDVQGGKMLVFTGTHLVNGYNPRSYSMDYRVVAAVYRPYDPLYVEKKNAFFKERDEFFLISNQR